MRLSNLIIKISFKMISNCSKDATQSPELRERRVAMSKACPHQRPNYIPTTTSKELRQGEESEPPPFG